MTSGWCRDIDRILIFWVEIDEKSGVKSMKIRGQKSMKSGVKKWENFENFVKIQGGSKNVKISKISRNFASIRGFFENRPFFRKSGSGWQKPGSGWQNGVPDRQTGGYPPVRGGPDVKTGGPDVKTGGPDARKSVYTGPGPLAGKIDNFWGKTGGVRMVL